MDSSLLETLTKSTFSIPGIFLLLMGGLLAIIFKQLSQHRTSKYDETRHKAVLSEIRASYESQISLLSRQLTATEDRWKEINHLLISAQNSQGLSKRHTERDFLRSMGVENDTPVEKKLVFVLTPFSTDEEETYQSIHRACRTLGLRCIRGDEEFASADILRHIVSLIARAELIIANIGSRNPNVYYELGIAQALGKPTILVSNTISDIPFDIKSRRIVVFKNQDELQSSVKDAIARYFAEKD